LAQVYGAGGLTVPKRGRLGTGSYWPQGTPIFRQPGNTFPPDPDPNRTIAIDPAKIGQIPRTPPLPEYAERKFGEQSRAGVGTIAGRNLTQTTGPSPLYVNPSAISIQPLLQPRVFSSPRDNFILLHPGVKPLQMPHERNYNSASVSKKKGLPYRAVFGAHRSMPTDSAFQHNPNAMYKHTSRTPPKPATEAVKVSASNRTLARVPRMLPITGGIKGPHRIPPPSFDSKGHLWYDPNNSFAQGRVNTTTARVGSGRWKTVKKSVV
jgi:hypothetical protein